MSIVLDEYEWAERMVGSRELGKKPVETLSRVAKYYLAAGYSKRDVRGMLDTFLVQCDPSASLSKWSDKLDSVARNADRRPLVRMDGVDVTRNEMEFIEKLEGRQLQRLAFTLLCAAKYWDGAREQNDHWVNSEDREIMQMANIRTSVRRQSLLYARLRDEGAIRFARKIDNLNVQILFIEDGDHALHIHDFRNLGYQYLKYCGEPYFECENCGLTVKINEPFRGRRQKYCPNCAVEVRVRQNVNAVMRQRGSVRNQA